MTRVIIWIGNSLNVSLALWFMPSMHAVYMKEKFSSVRYAYLSDVASEHSLLEGDMAQLGAARLISEQFLNLFALFSYSSPPPWLAPEDFDRFRAMTSRNV